MPRWKWKARLAAFGFGIFGTFCLFIASNAQTKGPTSVGARLFPTHCASCHGLDGRGGERGPDIADRSETRKLSDASLAKIIREGIPGTGMPSFRMLGAANIQGLVRHLRTLQGENVVSSLPGSPVAGKELFFGKGGCSECHMVNGAGGFIGSNLSVYGQAKSAAEIRGVIIDPGANPRGRGKVVVVTTKDGEMLTGVARNEDNFSLQLQTKDGAFHLLEKSSLRTVEHRAESLMPADYGTRLNTREIDDLVSYLLSVARSNVATAGDKGKQQDAEEGQE